jgi:hypothetical protein
MSTMNTEEKQQLEEVALEKFIYKNIKIKQISINRCRRTHELRNAKKMQMRICHKLKRTRRRRRTRKVSK